MKNILKLINNNDWDMAFNILQEHNLLYDNIIGGKNLLHLACIRGKHDIVNKYINLRPSSDNITISTDNGNNMAHLLSIHGWDDLLYDVIKKIPTLVKRTNNNNESFITYIMDRTDILKKIYKLLLKYDNFDVFNLISVDNITPMMYIVDNIDDNTIDNNDNNNIYIQILKHDKVDWKLPPKIPLFFYILEQNKINLAKYILKNVDFDPNISSENNITPLILSTIKNNYDITRLLIKKGANINVGTDDNILLPINISIKNRSLDNIKILLDSGNLDFNKSDSSLNTPLFYFIELLITGHYDDDDEDFISILKKFIKNTNIHTKNIDNISPYDLLKKYDLFDKLNISYNETSFNKTNMALFLPKSIESQYGLFNPDIVHNIIYMIYLKNTYKNIIMYPVQTPNKNKQEWDKRFIISYTSESEVIKSSITIHHDFFFTLVPAICFWKDKNIHFFCKNIEFYLRRAITQTDRFVILKFSLIPQMSSMHANIVIYDKIDHKLMRFEPYGDWEISDAYLLDKKLSKIFCSATNTHKIKYIRPGDFLSNSKFQTISQGDYKKHLGDPMGYCLAWCYWFIELKLKNPDIDEKSLVENALHNIIKTKNNNDKNPLLGYIRGYARNLDNEKNKILQELKIHNIDIYGLSYSKDKLKFISKYVENYVSQNFL